MRRICIILEIGEQEETPEERRMSGSGGTVYDPQPPRGPCERLTFRTVLNSPVPAVVRAIEAAFTANRAGLLLDIELDTKPNGLQVVVATYGGERAGSITSDALLRLIECLESGSRFVGEVCDVSGARVEIQVVHQ